MFFFSNILLGIIQSIHPGISQKITAVIASGNSAPEFIQIKFKIFSKEFPKLQEFFLAISLDDPPRIFLKFLGGFLNYYQAI